MMRAISMWQPWAMAAVTRVKKIETRGWSTDYRGLLVIHAALRWTKAQKEFAMAEHTLGRLPKSLPFGALIGVVNLVDVKPAEEILLDIDPIEKLYGIYGPGRYGWILEDAEAFKEPIPYIGRQSFFSVPDEILPAIRLPAGVAPVRPPGEKALAMMNPTLKLFE